MAADLTSKIQKLVKDGRLPGTGAVALDKSGNQIYNSAFGKLDANNADSKDFTNDTQMLIWSCTKFLTSLAILQLLEQGKISSIDDPVSKYLPSQSEVQVVTGLDAEGKPQGRAQATEMKLIHLLTHTGGYSRITLLLLDACTNVCVSI